MSRNFFVTVSVARSGSQFYFAQWWLQQRRSGHATPGNDPCNFYHNGACAMKLRDKLQEKLSSVASALSHTCFSPISTVKRNERTKDVRKGRYDTLFNNDPSNRYFCIPFKIFAGYNFFLLPQKYRRISTCFWFPWNCFPQKVTPGLKFQLLFNTTLFFWNSTIEIKRIQEICATDGLGEIARIISRRGT